MVCLPASSLVFMRKFHEIILKYILPNLRPLELSVLFPYNDFLHKKVFARNNKIII